MRARSPLEKRLRKRGSTWHVWGYDYKGERYERSTQRTDRTLALARARDIDAEMLSKPAEKRAGTLEDAIAELAAHDKRVGAAPNTIEFHEDRAAHLLRLMPGAVCDEITLAVLNTYTSKRLAEGDSRHTIQKEHRVLRHALRLAKVAGICTTDGKHLKVEGFVHKRHYYRPGKNWLRKPAHVAALLAEVVPYRRDDVLTIVCSGLRRRELLTLTRERVDLDDGVLLIDELEDVTLKTDESVRRIPMAEELEALLVRRMADAQSGSPLFAEWGSGNRDLQAAWARARVKLGGTADLPRTLSFNALRRTFCSMLKNRGVSRDKCADLLGHADTAMVDEVYGQADMDVLRDAVRKLPRMVQDAQTARADGSE